MTTATATARTTALANAWFALADQRDVLIALAREHPSQPLTAAINSLTLAMGQLAAVQGTEEL